MIFALLSLISYSINPEVVPGRLGLLVTLYLIASNVYNALNIPKNRGFSYIELWYSGIQLLIFGAILEYGIVLTMLKYWKKYSPGFIKKMDKWAFCLALIFLIIFNICYWSVAFSHVPWESAE